MGFNKCKGNVVRVIFILKNRFPNEWRDKRVVEVKKEENSQQLTLDEQLAKMGLFEQRPQVERFSNVFL